MPAAINASHLHKCLGFGLVLTLLGLGAWQCYWLSELLAALLIFILLSAIVGLFVLLVFFHQQSILKGITHFGLIAARRWLTRLAS